METGRAQLKYTHLKAAIPQNECGASEDDGSIHVHEIELCMNANTADDAVHAWQHS